MPDSAAARTRLLALGWAAPPAPLAWRVRLAVLRDAARALAHLHGQHLLHGDVKPSNILLDVHGSSAHLADFALTVLTADNAACYLRSSDNRIRVICPRYLRQITPSLPSLMLSEADNAKFCVIWRASCVI
jgi:serine/threonine protein kinase